DPEENKISPKRPHFSGISHLSIPCRDLEESKEFYTQVMGGELVHEIEGFFEVRIADVIVGLSERSEGWTGCDAEYPHYAFFVDAEDFLPMVAWLRQSGVTTTEPWTRDGIKGLSISAILREIYLKCTVRKSKKPPTLPGAKNKAEPTKS